jgi:hypothetical protein
MKGVVTALRPYRRRSAVRMLAQELVDEQRRHPEEQWIRHSWPQANRVCPVTCCVMAVVV